MKFCVLVLTAAVTVFAACNQFFKFKSRADACHTALRSILDVKDELALLCADPAERMTITEGSAGVLRHRIQNSVKDADLLLEEGSVWRRFRRGRFS